MRNSRLRVSQYCFRMLIGSISYKIQECWWIVSQITIYSSMIGRAGLRSCFHKQATISDEPTSIHHSFPIHRIVEDVIFSKLLFQFVQFVQMIENKIVEFRVELYEGKVEDLFSQYICRLGMSIQYKKNSKNE